MRLIDADVLEDKIDDISRGYTSVYGVEEDDIYNAETVEAILMEWIEKKRDEVVSDYKYIIDWLVLEWKKEQGETYNGNQ